jgi:hypothetical protein
MFRTVFVAFVLSGLVTTASAQIQPVPGPASGTLPAKSAVKKSAPKAKAAAKPGTPAESGPCRIGVIAATGDVLTMQKVGLTIFGNEYDEVPVTWGFDDLIVARVRSAAGGTPVRRIPYAKGAFDSYYKPQSTSLFRNTREELTTLVRQIAGNTGCERYVLITRSKGKLEGTNQMLEGIGVLNWGIGSLGRNFLFAYFSILVFDGETFEIRKDPQATLEAGFARLAANLTQSEYMRHLEDFAFPESQTEAASNARLRDGARGFLGERLDKYLPAYFKD